ncbi:MAG TPA: glycosyltransferase 87 family protein [Solirubrobacteraceae bacterium]|nr:glycosyltransferase 87 family protein [Solirubrobacteraceae bacterium]
MSRQAVGRAVRANALCASAAAAGSVTLAWLGLTGFAWSDYEVEARPALAALVHGHLAEFLRLAPAYGGSLVLRAPFVALVDLWGGGELAVYRMAALPCLLAAAAFAVWLLAQMRRAGRPRLARGVALALCVANPLTLNALEVGHPEELLGGVLCVAAVLAADRERPLWAGVLLGAAIANKDWALVAVGPVLLALPARRALCLSTAAGVAGAVLAPPALVHAGGFVTASAATAVPSSAIFQPWQVWWFLGHHGPVVHGMFGRVLADYRTGPGWVGDVSHPLIVVVGLPLSAVAWWRRERSRRGADVVPGAGRRAPTDTGAGTSPRVREPLLLLALLLLVRCMLDTWDDEYYLLPFVLALTTWEALGESGLPALALGGVALAWLDWEWLPQHGGPDLEAAVFLLWTLPLAAGLALRLYASRWSGDPAGRLGRPRAELGRRWPAPRTAR